MSQGFAKCWWDFGWKLSGEQRDPWVSDSGACCVPKRTAGEMQLAPSTSGSATYGSSRLSPSPHPAKRQTPLCPGPPAFHLLPLRDSTGHQGAPCGCLEKLSPSPREPQSPRKWLGKGWELIPEQSSPQGRYKTRTAVILGPLSRSHLPGSQAVLPMLCGL